MKAIKVTCVSRIAAVLTVTAGQCVLADRFS